MHEEKIGGLRTVLAGGLDRQGGGEGPVVALLHGFGASGDDLVSLWRAVDVPRAVRFAFPEAPLELPGFGGAAYAWWMIDVGRFQAAASGRVPPDALLDEVPPGMADARAAVLRWLEALRARLGVGPGQVVLGGFSQGAIMAVDVALRAEVALAGLAIMSGALVARAEWQGLLPTAKGVPFFQSHGTQDPLLPVFVGEALNTFLRARAGYTGELVRFRGGHEIPYSVVEQLGAYLRARLVG